MGKTIAASAFVVSLAAGALANAQPEAMLHVPAYPGPPCVHDCETYSDGFKSCLIYRRKYVGRDGQTWYEGWDCPEIVEMCNAHPEWKICQ